MTLSAAVAMRVQQIAPVQEYLGAISDIEIQRLASFIEKDLVQRASLVSLYVKKTVSRKNRPIQSNMPDPLLPRNRSIIRCAENGNIIILAKGYLKSLDKKTELGRLSSCVVLDHDASKAARVARQWVNSGASKTLGYYQRGATIHQALSGTTGIWPVENVCRYADPLEKLSVCLQADVGTFFDVIRQTLHLSRQTVLSLLWQLCKGLEYIHDTKGYVMTNIGPSQILVGEIGPERYVAGFANFDGCWQASREPPPTFLRGAYGIFAYTAPELFGRYNFTGDFAKCDIFALGCLFYHWYHGHEPGWVPKAAYLEPLLESLSERDRETFKKQIEQEVETKLALMNRSKSLSPNEKLLWLILNMLRVDPNERFSAKQLRHHLDLLIC